MARIMTSEWGTTIAENYELDVAVAIENTLLAAHGLGLEACLVGLSF